MTPYISIWYWNKEINDKCHLQLLDTVKGLKERKHLNDLMNASDCRAETCDNDLEL